MSNHNERGENFQRIDDTETNTLSLTLAEVLYIDDNISLMLDGRDFEHMMPLRPVAKSAIVYVPIDFIDKIGRAFVELMKQKTLEPLRERTVNISVSEMELYTLRELCISRVNFNGFRVGLTLKKKVLFALYQKRQTTIDIIEELLKDIDLGENK
jgi:hypothetical protein